MKIALRRVARATAGAGNAQGQWRERHALIVTIDDEHGVSGVGEAAPLPSYSPDTLDGNERALHAVRAADIEAALDCDDAMRAIDRVATLIPSTQPAARFALECAALDLLGRRDQASAPMLLGARADAACPLASLVGAAGDAGLVDAALRSLDAGYRCLKIKVGAVDAMAREIDGLTALRMRVGMDVRLRIDANRALTPAAAVAFCRAVAPLAIELFEEPCVQPLPSTVDTVPLALDESLQGVAPAGIARLASERGAQSVVLKPMALGGIGHCRALAAAARACRLDVIVSHLFDGPVAWRACAALALALDGRLAQGLAPHAGLSGWTPDTESVNRGMLRGWQAAGLGVESGCVN